MDIEKYPIHVGIIPDGNRRWSRQHDMPVEAGYAKGIEVLEKLSKWALSETPIRYLTVYGLSTENLLRKGAELDVLFGLYEKQFNRILNDAELEEKKIQIRVLGQRELLPTNLQNIIGEVEEKTKQYKNRQLNIALGYGGREELLMAIRDVTQRMIKGNLGLDYITEAHIKECLYTNGAPYPDLIVRTAEKRLSNFLLWQSAYSELAFIDKTFPDLTIGDLQKTLSEYANRERRYGI